MRHSSRFNCTGRRPLIGVLATLTLAAAPMAHAVNFEGYYGQKDTRDDGQDVKAARYCPDNGSIVVGSRYYADGSSEALATRVKDDGTTMWQRAYRVANSKQTTANAVVELNDGKGFALTGAVVVDPGAYIYVMQIGCDGKVAWATQLPNQKVDYRAVGYDIIQSTGRPPVGLAAATTGDLVVVGDEVVDPASGAGLGRIARIAAGGAVIWNQAYTRTDIPFGLRFRAVAENVAASGAYTDLVVAGSAADARTWTSDRRALIFRTDANGTPVCNTILGQQGENKDFYGLTPLLSRDFPGDSVLVGGTARVGSLSDGYLARFKAGGCTVQAQSMWIDSDRGDTVAYDAAEVLGTDAGPGSVAATGTISNGTSVGFLLSAKLADLTENTPPGSRLYGTQRDKPEDLFSMDIKGDRFVLAGGTFEDWDGIGDPEDFYLVQTDPGENTKCSVLWKPESPRVESPAKRFTPRVLRIPEYKRVDVKQIDADGEGYCCERDPPPDDCPGVIDNGTVQLGVSNTGFLNIECDKSTLSAGRYGTTLVGLRLMSTNGDASAPGSPCEGWGVASNDLTISGYTSLCAGTVNVVVDSFTASLTSATSVVHIGSTFRVTHSYNPTPVTPYLYQVDVTIENIGTVDVLDLRYTRGVDYDVAPNTFSEYITINGSAAPIVLASNDNGFNSLDPLAGNSGTPGDFTDLGPGDLGAHFDFGLGTLKVGEKRSFVTYYGAAPDEVNALNALALVGAGIYSLGEPDWDGNPLPAPPWSSGAGTGAYGSITGEPNTFMYGMQYRTSTH